MGGACNRGGLPISGRQGRGTGAPGTVHLFFLQVSYCSVDPREVSINLRDLIPARAKMDHGHHGDCGSSLSTASSLSSGRQPRGEEVLVFVLGAPQEEQTG